MRPQQLPDLLPAGVEAYLLEFDPAGPLDEADWAVLQPQERVQAQRFHRHADVVRAVRTRAELRRLIGARLQRRPERLRFTLNAFGKPRLGAACSGDPELHFNVSHAGRYALIAVSSCSRVGVDIERRDESLDLVGLQMQALSSLERQLPADQRPDFYDCWTVKEAVMKALGLGVGEHLQRLSVLTPAPDAAEPGATDRYRLRYDNAAWPPLAAQRLTGPVGYAASLAWLVAE